MEQQTVLIAERLKWARENLEITSADMAQAAGVTTAVYENYEKGETDFSFTFLYKCAVKLGMDISELVSGLDPKLSFYNITRSGKGMPIKRREEFNYRHIAPFLKHRLAEPFIVTAGYNAENENKPILVSSHKGQELNYILKGSMIVQLDEHQETLHEGDSIYYDSTHPHGMIATGGEDCIFMAIVFKDNDAEDGGAAATVSKSKIINQNRYDNLLYKKYVIETIDDNGRLIDIKFNIPENFNFSYDVVDELAKKCPDKRAFLWLSSKKEVRDFSFGEVSKLSNRAANYFTSLGVKKGDRVMLVLKRHWQFWISAVALHKLGAVVLPATSLLMKKDYEYRFNAAKVSTLICTAEDGCPEQVDLAHSVCDTLVNKILVSGKRDGWKDFDDYMNFPEAFERVETSKDDPSIMLFTSGTTGYPKIATHSATYPVSHIITARWWHNVNPDGLHFTISDTGWGKALWGKLYGQWLCEAPVFVYDFIKFNAEDILPLFKEHNITTFCAPPTMYRFFIKEDLSKYDLSSLEYVTTAGEALNPEVYYQFQKATGLNLMEGFGQTETTLSVATLYGMDPKPGCMGKPSPMYDINLLKEDGTEAGVGEVGEIVVKTDKRSDGVFSGYYLQDDKTKEVWYDGAYHTGDTAWRDEDGYIWYVGRVDDLIKSSGYRIGPFEIESVIMELPYVLECAVIGVPDEVRGQVVKATIVLTKDTKPTDELKNEIQSYVKEQTAPYKYPRIVEFATELPKTISGKIKRNVIRGQKDDV